MNKAKLLGSIFIFDALTWGLGGAVLIAVRLVLYLYAVLMIFPIRDFRNKAVMTVVLLAVYLFSLGIFNSSSISNSLNDAFKTILSLLMFIYAFSFIKTKADLLIVSKYAYYSLWMFFIIILASNIFKFGEINYHDESIRFGVGGVNIVKNIFLITIFSVPHIASPGKFRNRFFRYVAIFISLIVILLAVKRTVLLLIVLSGVLYLYFNRKHIVKTIFISMLAIIPGTFLFYDRITDRFEIREERLDVSGANIEEEWRYIETSLVLNKFENGDLKTKLIGYETFNEMEAYRLSIMFHNDFALLLGGTGLIGLTLYGLLIIILLLQYRMISSILSQDSFMKMMYLSFITGLIVMGISGSFRVLGSTMSVALAGLGAIQGIALNQKRQEII